MFGLTFDKLLLIAILTGFLIGPGRLPVYTRQLTDMLRSFRGFLEVTRTRAELDLNLNREEWEALDPRRYDPRHVVRKAFTHQPPEAVTAAAEPAADPVDPRVQQAADIRPGQKYLATGPASHPRRVLIASLPEDDPRRVAAKVVLEPGKVLPDEPDPAQALLGSTATGAATVAQ